MRNLSIPFALSALSMPATPAGEAPEAPAEATVEVVGDEVSPSNTTTPGGAATPGA